MDGGATAVRPIRSGMNPIYIFLLLVLGLTIGFGIIMGSSSRHDTMAHWAERRCDLDVIAAAFMYKPSDDSSTSFEFSSNNFKFCIGVKAEEYLQTLFGSLFGVLDKQMGVAAILTNVMKVMRIQLADIYGPFSSTMNGFWNKFKQIGSLASRIFQHLYMSMKKAAGAAVATIFIAISLQTAMMNSIDLIIKIIMIVLYILLGLSVIFFIPILPVLILVFLVTAGIEEVYPGRTGGMGTVFCFAPDTQIILEDSTTRDIKTIGLGTILKDGQRVEAVLELPGSDELYMLDGIRVSGQHLVEYKGDFIEVKEHPDAYMCLGIPTLWTLITSNRQIPVKGMSGCLVFSDWEEMPDTFESAKAWDSIVRSVVGIKDYTTCPVPRIPPCFDETIMVLKYQSGFVPLSSIVRGDWIMSENRWTHVIGICSREVEGSLNSNGNRITDGVWIKMDEWTHPTGQLSKGRWRGVNLITDSGTFIIKMGLEQYVVRDFTEVGWTNLSETYVKERAESKNL